MTPRQTVLASVMARSAEGLANSAEAHLFNEGGAGEAFLTDVRDALVEAIQFDANASLQADDLEGVRGEAGRLADDAIPSEPDDLWAAFTDLRAWREDLTDLGPFPTHLRKCAEVALYLIGDRLVQVLVGELLDAEHLLVACPECGAEYDESEGATACEECSEEGCVACDATPGTPAYDNLHDSQNCWSRPEVEAVSAEVWVGVIEWGSDRDDRDPYLAAGENAEAVRRWGAGVIHGEWSDDPDEWDVDPEHLPALDLNDPASVQAWLLEWRGQTTEALLTVERQPVLEAVR